MTFIKETTIKNGRKHNRFIKAINKEMAMKDILSNFEKRLTKSELDNIIQKNSDFVNGVAGGARADLSGANLSCADLSGADLSCADLSGANLRVANLRGAALHDSYLIGANIATAFLDEKEQPRMGTILKKKMIGYKKLADGSICVLSIPKGAIVFSINGSKCRTNKASVLDGGGASSHDREFVYEKGEKYEISDFNLAYNLECASGIHFFKTRKEAVDYKS